MADKHLKLLNGPEQHSLNIGQIVDRAFWALLSLLVWLGVENLKELSHTVSELNAKIAVVIEQVSGHERRIELLENQPSFKREK